jgi:hypothetical protein
MYLAENKITKESKEFHWTQDNDLIIDGVKVDEKDWVIYETDSPQELLKPKSKETMTRPFTKFSQNNLRVIQNFLLYIQKEDEFGQAAIDYISEDHVDGEDSPQALLERAESSELIREDVYMGDDVNEIHPCNIYVDNDLIIYCVNKTNNDVVLYGLVGDQEEIATKHMDEILSYCLGCYTKDDEVSLGDIFVHGIYVKKLSQ